MKQEEVIKLSFLEQQASKIEEQLRIINQQVIELQNLMHSLDELQETKEKDILAGLGRGIFVNAELKNREFLVDVGDKTFIKNNSEGVKNMIKMQVDEMDKVKGSLIENIAEINQEMEKIVVEAQKEKEKD